jgi:hypothetical protein
MNPLGILTLILGLAVFGATVLYLARRGGTAVPLLLWVFALILALPAAAYDIYYLHFFEPIWLYRLRTIPGSELLAACAGMLAGLLQMRTVPRLHLSKIGKSAIVPVLFTLFLLLPYLKPVFRPVRIDALTDSWKEGVCQQSSGATCGPASVATILHHFGIKVTERELAHEAYSCASGTESWYLARTIKSRGLNFSFTKDNPSNVPLPAMAGVKLLSTGGAGHFIAVLGRTNDVLTIADPLEGREAVSISELRAKYEFTGFFLVIRPGSK